MMRKHKKYVKPKRVFDKPRIEEEAKIKEEFGLKNKKEIWKAESMIKIIRESAKKLIPASPEEQKELFDKLSRIGLKANSIADVLSLEKRDYLNRRLQTILFRKKLAPSAKAARQLITHKKVLVNGRVVDSPSYIIPLEFEDKVSIKKTAPKEKNKPLTEMPSEKTEAGTADVVTAETSEPAPVAAAPEAS